MAKGYLGEGAAGSGCAAIIELLRRSPEKEVAVGGRCTEGFCSERGRA